MNARVEAAAKAIHKYDTQAALSTTYAPNKHHRFEAEAALAAADAVMFGEDAIERAAEAAESSHANWGSWEDVVRVVIAALKGDGE